MDSLQDQLDFLRAAFITIMWIILVLGPLLGGLWTGYYMITLRMRRQERARFLLDVLEIGLKQGHRIEEIIIAISDKREESLGVHFHLLAYYLKDGVPLGEALKKVPQLLPPQMLAMLTAGIRLGDFAKVLPACRKLSNDAVSHTRGAINYLVLIAFIGFPINLLIVSTLQIWVLPQFMSVCEGMGISIPSGLVFLTEYKGVVMMLQFLLFLIVWTVSLVYIEGPRLLPGLEKLLAPMSHSLIYSLPWRRKRLQRDFATMLAILVDSGMPEQEALILAADCTANSIFRKRAQHAVAGLQRGLKLTQAVELVDDSGEFRWRLAHAMHTPGAFLVAIGGWNESLDAKAFQQEQAVAQTFTTAIVLLNGVLVGFIVVSVFSVLVSLINGALLW
jgi:type II secretory pathway component PulF